MNLARGESSSQAVAAEVRAWMGRRQRSTRSLAAELGVTETYLGRRLKGSISFSVAELATIAEILGVPLDAFFESPAGVRIPGVCPGRTDHELELAA